MLQSTHWIFVFILALWFVVYVTTTWLTRVEIQKRSRNYADKRSGLFGHIIDSVTNHDAVRSFSCATHEKKQISALEDKVIDARFATVIYSRLVNICLSSFDVFIVFAAMYTAFFYLFDQGKVDPSDFLLLSFAYGCLMDRVAQMNQRILVEYDQIGIGQEAIHKLLVPSAVQDAADAKALNVTEGTITLTNLVFSYTADQPVLQGINLAIHAGEKIGFVGYSGAGKSTLVHLLLRLYDVQSGTITIDGQNIAQVTQDSLRQAIAFIPQDISLFHRSLAENIGVAKEGASLDEVIHAAKLAGADEFISALPLGYDTLVGERGIKLSGGQRQRIAIARAFLKAAPILILDEATSALDSMTERTIQHALDAVMQGRTTLVIAHRLSTLRQMDRIIVLDKGQIVEQGTHEELLAHGGSFAKMWAMQAGGFLPEKEES